MSMSPLNIKPTAPIQTDEHRSNTPAGLRIRIAYESEIMDAQLVNVSATSVSLGTNYVCPIGTELEMHFSGAGYQFESLLTITAIVRSCSFGKLGVQFVNLRPSNHIRVIEMAKQLATAKNKR
jgi:hypothetical protein